MLKEPDTREYVVSDAAVEAYRRDGAVCTRAVIEPAKVERLRAEIMRIVENPGFTTVDASHEVEDFWSLVSTLPAIAARLTGSRRLRFYNDSLWVKRSGASAATGFHQDQPFWPLGGDQITGAWIPLGPVPKEASGMQYVAGSHASGQHYRSTERGDPNYQALPAHPDYFEPEARAKVKILSWDVEAGDVLWHHPLTLHGAEANNSTSTPLRAGLTVRFLGDDVIWKPNSYSVLPRKLPNVKAGEYPADEAAFPLVWDSGRRCGPVPALG